MHLDYSGSYSYSYTNVSLYTLHVTIPALLYRGPSIKHMGSFISACQSSKPAPSTCRLHRTFFLTSSYDVTTGTPAGVCLLPSLPTLVPRQVSASQKSDCNIYFSSSLANCKGFWPLKTILNPRSRSLALSYPPLALHPFVYPPTSPSYRGPRHHRRKKLIIRVKLWRTDAGRGWEGGYRIAFYRRWNFSRRRCSRDLW